MSRQNPQPRRSEPRAPKESAAQSPSKGGRRARGAAAAQDAAGAWNEVANFVVTFERRERGERRDADGVERRISAHKMQDGGISAAWTGIEQQPMCAWIADHLGADWAEAGTDAAPEAGAAERLLGADPTAPPAVSEPHKTLPPSAASMVATSDDAATPVEPRVVALAVSHVRPVRPGSHGAANTSGHAVEPTREPLQGDAPFDLEALVRVEAVSPCGPAQEPLSGSVQFFCRNMATAEKRRLGEVPWEQAAQGGTTHCARLSSVCLPKGRYRLASIAKARGTAHQVAYSEGPLLEVV
jgi:hypothetical protein